MSIYERILTENEIRALYNNGSGLSYPFEDEYVFSLFPPVDLRAKALKNKVFLSWESQELFNIAYHKIYRGSHPDNLDSVGYQPFTDEIVNVFYDSTIQKNQTYYYAVSTVNQSRLESMRSNTSLATMAAVEESSIWVDTSSILNSKYITPTIRFSPVLGSVGYIVNIIGSGFFIHDSINVNGYLISKPLKLGSVNNFTIQSVFENQDELVLGPITTSQFKLDSIRYNPFFLNKHLQTLNSEVVYATPQSVFYMEDFSEKNAFQISKYSAPQIGNGIFELAKELSKTSYDNLKTIGLGAEDIIKLPLKCGWNLLRNPFQDSFNWSKVSPNKQPLILWNGNGFQIENEMKPDLQYYYFNESEPTSIDLNFFDLVVLKDAFDESDVTEQTEFTITAEFSNESGLQRLSLFETETDSFIEIAAPTAPFNVNALSFISDSRKVKKEQLIAQKIPLITIMNSLEQGVSIPLQITENIDYDELMLNFSKSNWPKEIQICLVNKENGMYWDLRENEKIKLNKPKLDGLELLLGSENYIDLQINTISHSIVSLFETKHLSNSKLVELNLSLPKGKYVKWEFFNSLGIPVKLELNSFLQSGRYSFIYDVGNLGKGAYLYRFQVGEEVYIKKLLNYK